MGNAEFSSLELSAIGEIINISLGASATAVSNMLDTKVDITTPNVCIQPVDEFDFSILDPAVCAEISYKQGLQGKNGLLLKVKDVKTIVEMLMHTEIPDDEFELDDFNLSAICEVMNQMMGAAATALSEFLDRTVDISTPSAYRVEDPDEFKAHYFEGDNEVVSVRFDLKIGDRLESEFINIMRIPLAKELVRAFIPDSGDEEEGIEEVYNQAAKPAASEPEPESSGGGGGGVLSQEEIEKLINGGLPSEPAPEPEPASTGGGGGMMSQEEIEELMKSMGDGGAGSAPAASAAQQTPVMPTSAPTPQQMPQMAQMPQAAVNGNVSVNDMYAMMQSMMEEIRQLKGAQGGVSQQENNQQGGRVIKTHPIPSKGITVSGGIEQMDNKDLVMGVPLELSVEIGRARKTVREILDLSKGSLVVLDKLAGEQVDLFVNGQCIARGDVVVVEDNFGLRITEIINKNEVSF